MVTGDKVVTWGFRGSLVTFVHVFHFNLFLEALTQSKGSTGRYPVQGEEDGIPALTLERRLQPAFPEQAVSPPAVPKEPDDETDDTGRVQDTSSQRGVVCRGTPITAAMNTAVCTGHVGAVLRIFRDKGNAGRLVWDPRSPLCKSGGAPSLSVLSHIRMHESPWSARRRPGPTSPQGPSRRAWRGPEPASPAHGHTWGSTPRCLQMCGLPPPPAGGGSRR